MFSKLGVPELIIILVIIAYGLFTIIPKLGTYADDLYQMYAVEIRKAIGKED